MPNTLTLIRHGQSQGNLDEILYSIKPDNAMHLTKLGWDTAKMAGRALKEQIGEGESVHFVVSPYVRTVETFHGIVSAWCCPEDYMNVEDDGDGRNKRLRAWYSKLMEMGENVLINRLFVESLLNQSHSILTLHQNTTRRLNMA
jgi:broad specificity phosphatase PhoE